MVEFEISILHRVEKPFRTMNNEIDDEVASNNSNMSENNDEYREEINVEVHVDSTSSSTSPSPPEEENGSFMPVDQPTNATDNSSSINSRKLSASYPPANANCDEMEILTPDNDSEMALHGINRLLKVGMNDAKEFFSKFK